MPIPADNPYLPALEVVGAPRWTPAKSPDAAAMSLIVQALRTGADTPTVDWGVDYTRLPWEQLFPHIHPARALAQAALTHADRLLAADSSAAALLVLDVTALGRHLGSDTACFLRIEIERQCAEWLGRRLPGLGPDTVAALQKRFAALPRHRSWRESFTKRRSTLDALFRQLALLVWQKSEAEPTPPARPLRLTGLFSESGSVRLGLESPDASFRLGAQQTLHGVTLMALDLERQQALLSDHGRLVRLDLRQQAFTSMDERGVHAALATLVPDHPLRRYCEAIAASPGLPVRRPDRPPAWLSASLPDSLSEWRESLVEIETGQEAILALIEAPPGSVSPRATPAPRSALAKAFLDNAEIILATATADRIRDAQLAAALAAGTGRPPAEAIDPSSGLLFRVIPTPGGYILESPTPHRKGPPLRFVVGEAPLETAAK